MFRSVVLRRVSTVVMAAGLVVMLVVGLWAEQYTATWVDPGSGCTPAGACEDPAKLRLGWWLVGLGGLIVLAGVVLRWLALHTSSEAVSSGQARSAALAGRRVWWACILTALSAVAIGAGVLLVVTFATNTDHSILAVACVGAVAQAYTVASIAVTVPSTARAPRVAWAMGVAAGVVAAGGAAAVALGGIDVADDTSWWVVVAWTVGATVVAAIGWTVGALRPTATVARRHVP